MNNYFDMNIGNGILVDAKDQWLLHFKWWIDKSSSKYTSYARCGINRNGWRKMILLHRAIMQPESDQFVDHKNGNGLDNRRSNLRICNRGENNRNVRPTRKSSRYKGISWRTKDKCWIMQICVPDSKKKRITEVFNKNKEVEAAKRYDYHAKRLHKEFAYLNFPDET